MLLTNNNNNNNKRIFLWREKIKKKVSVYSQSKTKLIIVILNISRLTIAMDSKW